VLVGEYDPAKLAGFSDLSAVSMETYQSPELPGADAPSRKALGDKPLIPSGNPGAYLSSPPLLLTTLDALPVLKIKNPISAVRVRLAGHLGVDPVSRERVRLAAQRIHDATGLDVDITVGASPAPQKLALPSGSLGRPALLLTERWTKKGVAVAILRAIDRKSVVLFGLILIVCLLFLLNAVTAAVRERRRELAILACLGWPRLRLAALIGGETALLGLLAGAVSAALSIPVAALAHITLGTTHALLAVPVGVCLAVVAAAGPAWRASLVTAASALEPGARPARRRRTGRRRTVAGLALTNLARTPGRTALAAVALAVGVASVTMLLAVTVAFHGAVTGTLLGDAVSLQVRTVDEVAVAAIVLLGLVAVADVLYLGITERASEFATLRATGWSETAIARLVTTEGIGIGVFGALLGAGVGIGAAIGFSGSLPSALSLYTALVALAGVVAAGLTALAPALLGGRMSMSTPLAEE
jgi:predicted lysophospholipase L1 biosynthesis ABC-type transport system permease subunit